MKTTFINSKNILPPEETINEQTVEKFINMFNDTITKGEEIGPKCTIHLNDGLDEIPTLNEKEFNLAKSMAQREGWILTKFSDNYQSTTYVLTKHQVTYRR